ncbi:hypothetical protein PPERSA_09529 [Pseudocohnilembus persalinus]|uniref:CDP-alcohol phosphatidyltransferase n=1 Tax=Pseudocohnilembus persalinus TaxID=266149 RepID=A0A0V0QFF3_PSEPJ|nr:hypothetical protein PPERSA_09529 [Pseudocohnilembus persalinus]|eukprot:KRX00923.1 hypothetical protein PPERSA_09529 [Pseudocohnilembus persalinus]
MKNICDTQYYITEAGYKGIQQFKYKGGSSSILYEYIWSPLCNWIVDHLIPSSIAPNTITLVASLQMIATHFVILYYSPDFKTNLPTWLIVWAGISTLIYQILDNCDGKQARKTGSSSPLGMLFDHGCDSVITWILYLTMINVLQLGHNWIPYFCGIFISQISFYMAQWAQYHAGVFKLGYINAIDEGLVLVEANYIFTAIVGQQFWSNQIPQFYNFTYGETAMLATGLGAFIQCILFIFDAHKQDIEEIGIEKKGKAESLICVFWL